MLQIEDTVRVKKFNEDVILDMSQLYNNYSRNTCSNWDIVFNSLSIKLGQNIFTEDNFYSAVQEILIYKDKYVKSFNLAFSIPSEIIIIEIGNTTLK